MKRVNNLFEKIADTNNLALAAYKAFKGKSRVREVIEFRKKFLWNICLLRDELLTCKYEIGHYHQFTIFEPKQRIILAAPLRQRILHHAIMNVCHDVFDKHLIYDSYASRPGKGTHKAILRLKSKMRSYKFFAKLDVRKFFDSIDHSILKQSLCKIFKDVYLLDLLFRIIDSHGENKGLPIGNLTSQYFANHYLSSLDHHIKEEVRARVYIRYMDDIVILCSNKEDLKNIVAELVCFADRELSLIIKPPLIGRTCNGILFLGYKVFSDRILISGKGKRRYKKNLGKLNKLYVESKISELEYSKRIVAQIAYSKFADSYKFRKSLRMNVI